MNCGLQRGMSRKVEINPEAARIGDLIAAARDAKGMDNGTLAKKMGRADSSIKKLITGEANGQFVKLAKLARALETTPNQLLGFGSNDGLDAESVRLAFDAVLAALSVPQGRAELLKRTALSALQSPTLPLHDRQESTKARLALELEQVLRSKPS